MLVLAASVVSAQNLDISITAPVVDPGGPLSAEEAVLNSYLQSAVVGDLEAQIEGDAELNKFVTLPMLATAAANSGSAAAHLGTQRSFSDYRSFAFVVGTGGSVAAPGVNINAISAAAEDIEAEGDVYVGAAVQPVNASLGINLNRWVPRTRVDLKVGYASIEKGTIADEVGFESLAVGVGVNYQLLRSRQLPLGFVRWRGLTFTSGFLYQRNETQIDVEIADSAFSQPFTYQDAGLTNPFGADTETLATVEVAPTVTAALESTTYSVPLELSTGVRILWLLDLNVGAGIDVAFGSSDLVFGADAVTELIPADPQAADLISSTPGSVGFGVSNSEAPQLLRPRLTGGVTVNLGPVKLDVPVMLYFDEDGNTLMAGVNLGIVW